MADADIIPCLINRWILDYESYELWKKFSDNLRVHQTWQTLFIDYISDSGQTSTFKGLDIKPQDDSELISTLLIKLMCSISSASKLPPDINTENITPLEESLKYIDQLVECAIRETVKALLSKLRRVIRQECVVICFKCYKIKLAKTVYERVWSNCTNPKESASKANLLNFFKDDVNVKASIESFSISELMENCRKFFAKYFSSTLVPFLIRNAERIFDVHSSTLSLASKKKKITSENSKSKHFLIQCWFADYFSYLAWTNIDHLHSSKFDWILKFVSENNNLETKSCLLIRFMFKFSERKSMEDSLHSYLSPLELCLELLKKADKLDSDECEGLAEASRILRQELKRHAVLMWCSKNLYEKANIVFNRLFQDDNAGGDSGLKANLENILEGHEQLLLDENKLKDSMTNYFSKIFQGQWYLYLPGVAESVVGKMKRKIARAAVEAGSADTKKRQRTTKKLPDDFVSTDSIEEDVAGKRKRDSHKSFVDDEAGGKFQEDDADSEVGGETREEKKRRVDRKKRVWSEEDEEVIYRGVKMYGVGNWALVAKQLMVSRTVAEVKDKWKVMVKQGRIEKYIKEIGPLPGLTLDDDEDY